LQHDFVYTIDFQEKNQHLQPGMRRRLVEWLMEVSNSFGLSDMAFHQATGFVDQFLAKNSVPIQELQLLGVSALFIASKLHDVAFLPMDSALDVCDGLYAKEDIFAMERRMLASFRYRLHDTCVIDLVEMLSQDQPQDLRATCKLLSDICLCDIELCKVSKATLAAAIVRISAFFLNVLSDPEGCRSLLWTPCLPEGSVIKRITLMIAFEIRRTGTTLWDKHEDVMVRISPLF
jgi:hypothetical protein